MSLRKETGFDSRVYDNYQEVRRIDKTEEVRPYNFLEIVKAYTPNGAVFLDAGCGEAFKLDELIKIEAPVAKFIGFDINEKLARAAMQRKLTSLLNIDLVRADINSSFPFPGNHFDVVTFMMSRHNAAEAYRVLKPGGVVIMERAGEGEKREAKFFFGKDEQGPRGYLLDKEEGAILKEYIADFRSAGLTIVEAQEAKWQTWVDRKGLLALLKGTPFVRNFDPVKDADAVNAVEKHFQTEKGIALTQHRVVIVARK